MESSQPCCKERSGERFPLQGSGEPCAVCRPALCAALRVHLHARCAPPQPSLPPRPPARPPHLPPSGTRAMSSAQSESARCAAKRSSPGGQAGAAPRVGDSEPPPLAPARSCGELPGGGRGGSGGWSPGLGAPNKLCLAALLRTSTLCCALLVQRKRTGAAGALQARQGCWLPPLAFHSPSPSPAMGLHCTHLQHPLNEGVADQRLHLQRSTAGSAGAASTGRRRLDRAAAARLGSSAGCGEPCACPFWRTPAPR